eukprot:CAMPEP_0196808380 /NCGR_PEP_ID=MMETSP1362-20130617/8359_1 /TAXON_ID=163516 /ORGANISM="Leptocylindrus danicus, Strain CCMP1856" /LENGTH=225 /DNA_ID=CAMNT_0042182689 /DNA_START=34 /DNA_END=707 /DNA_ORIENTATION=-
MTSNQPTMARNHTPCKRSAPNQTSQDSSQVLCSICFDEVDDKTKVKLEPCGHIVCVACMISHLFESRTNPLAQEDKYIYCPSKNCCDQITSHSMSKVRIFGRNGNTRTEAIRYTHKPRQIKTDLTETRSFIDEIREELKEEGPKSYLFISAVSIQKTKVVDDSETLRWQVGKSTTATYFRLDENNLKPPMTKGRDLAAIFHRLHPVLFKEAQDKRDKVMSKLEDG